MEWVNVRTQLTFCRQVGRGGPVKPMCGGREPRHPKLASEQIDPFRLPTGITERLAEGERPALAPVGYTWRQVAGKQMTDQSPAPGAPNPRDGRPGVVSGSDAVAKVRIPLTFNCRQVRAASENYARAHKERGPEYRPVLNARLASADTIQESGRWIRGSLREQGRPSAQRLLTTSSNNGIRPRDCGAGCRQGWTFQRSVR